MGLTRQEKKHIENGLKDIYYRQAIIKVYLKRLPYEAINVELLLRNNKIYIYDMFANKTYSMRHYGKKWALVKSELK